MGVDVCGCSSPNFVAKLHRISIEARYFSSSLMIMYLDSSITSILYHVFLENGALIIRESQRLSTALADEPSFATPRNAQLHE